MGDRIIRISYYKDADMLEVSWDRKTGYMAGTEYDWVLANVDTEGNLQGLQIEGVTQLEDGVLEVRIPSPEEAEKPQKSRS
jgi:hypothetical protein